MISSSDFKLIPSAKRNAWIPDFSQTVFFIVTAYCLRDLFVCYDSLWQVKVGEWIWKNRTIPRFDPGFSISDAPIPWQDFEWLSQLVLFGLWNIGGFVGLRVILSLIPAVVFSRVMSSLRKEGVSPLSAFFFTVLAAIASAQHWLARPHMLGYVLMLLSLSCWQRFNKGNCSSSISLILLQVFWVNAHQSFLLQFIFAGSFALDVVLSYSNNRPHALDQIRNVLTLLFALFLASLLNPNGIGVFKSPVPIWETHGYIEEWQPVYFDSNVFPFFLGYAAVLLLAMWKNRQEVKLYELAIFTSTVLMTFGGVRLVPVFVFCTLSSYVRHVPVLSSLLSKVTRRRKSGIRAWFRRRNELLHSCEMEFDGKKLTFTCWLLLLLFSVSSFHIPQLSRVSWNGLNRNFFPIPAVNFVDSKNIRGNIFSSYAWGGYLAFRLSGESRVFIDGRADMYGVGRMEEYYTIYEAKRGWEELLEKYRVVIVLAETDWKLCEKLLEDGRWSLVYSDRQASLFLLDSKFHNFAGELGSVKLMRREPLAKGAENLYG